MLPGERFPDFVLQNSDYLARMTGVMQEVSKFALMGEAPNPYISLHQLTQLTEAYDNALARRVSWTMDLLKNPPTAGFLLNHVLDEFGEPVAKTHKLPPLDTPGGGLTVGTRYLEVFSERTNETLRKREAIVSYGQYRREVLLAEDAVGHVDLLLRVQDRSAPSRIIKGDEANFKALVLKRHPHTGIDDWEFDSGRPMHEDLLSATKSLAVDDVLADGKLAVGFITGANALFAEGHNAMIKQTITRERAAALRAFIKAIEIPDSPTATPVPAIA